MRAPFGLAAITFALAGNALALTGRGALSAGAGITVIHTQNGLRRSTVSNMAGIDRLDAADPGLYELEIEQANRTVESQVNPLPLLRTRPGVSHITGSALDRIGGPLRRNKTSFFAGFQAAANRLRHLLHMGLPGSLRGTGALIDLALGADPVTGMDCGSAQFATAWWVVPAVNDRPQWLVRADHHQWESHRISAHPIYVSEAATLPTFVSRNIAAPGRPLPPVYRPQFTEPPGNDVRGAPPGRFLNRDSTNRGIRSKWAQAKLLF